MINNNKKFNVEEQNKNQICAYNEGFKWVTGSK